MGKIQFGSVLSRTHRPCGVRPCRVSEVEGLDGHAQMIYLVHLLLLKSWPSHRRKLLCLLFHGGKNPTFLPVRFVRNAKWTTVNLRQQTEWSTWSILL